MLFQAKSKEIERLLERHPIQKIQFDDNFRCYYPALHLRSLSTAEIKHLYWLGSCHSSGYEREKCLKLILDDFEPEDINRVLMRLMDWVPEIRTTADRWLLRNYETVPIENFLFNLKLIAKICRKPGLSQLTSVKKLLEHLSDFLVSQPNLHKLVPDSKVRRFAIAFMANPSKARTYLSIKHDPDPMIRLMAFSDEFQVHVAEDLDQWVSDKSVQVKMVLLRKYISHETTKYSETLYGFLADRNQSLRSSARFYLKRDFAFDGYTYCKTHLNQHPDYVLFLSDFPKLEDVALYAESIKSPRKILALAALRALDSLDKLDLGKSEYFSLIFSKGKIAKFVARQMSKYMALSKVVAQRNEFIQNNQVLLYTQIILQLDSTTGLREALMILDVGVVEPVIRLIKAYIYRASWRPSMENGALVTEIRQLATHLSNTQKLSEEILNQILFITRT